MKKDVHYFVSLVAHAPPMRNVFNPWGEVDREHDCGPEAPLIRARHLRCYLEERFETARYLLVGEALGYQGGHFSGIAMTSERILLGHHRARGIKPRDIFSSVSPRRTSRPEIKPRGFTEPTGTIVWTVLREAGIRPDAFTLWNTFAWHPFDPKKGMLSNRRPTPDELKQGLPVLRAFLKIFAGKIVVAVGKVALAGLGSLGIDCREVRHPARGGVREFKSQMQEILGCQA